MGTYGNGKSRRVSPYQKSASSGFNDYVFVDRRLGESEREAWLKWTEGVYKDAFLLLGELASSEHKISLTWQSSGDCFICSFTCNDESSPNYHVILTSRSDVAEEAVLLNLYKAYVIYENRAWTSEDHGKNWG